MPLTIELPIEERNRTPLDDVVFPDLQASRLLVLASAFHRVNDTSGVISG